MRHLRGFLNSAPSGESDTERQAPGFITTSGSLREEKVLPRKTLILGSTSLERPGFLTGSQWEMVSTHRLTYRYLEYICTSLFFKLIKHGLALQKVQAERCSEAPQSGRPWACSGDSWPKQGDLEEGLVGRAPWGPHEVRGGCPSSWPGFSMKIRAMASGSGWLLCEGM